METIQFLANVATIVGGLIAIYKLLHIQIKRCETKIEKIDKIVSNIQQNIQIKQSKINAHTVNINADKIDGLQISNNAITQLEDIKNE